VRKAKQGFTVFVRNWWRWENDALTPDPTARKHTLCRYVPTEEDAQQICREYNASHKPGPLSRKAEYGENR